MRQSMVLVLATLLAVSVFALPVSAQRPIEARAIWSGGELYGTVPLGTLPYRNNPHSFDQLFVFPGEEQRAVSEAAPGSREYNGGRWIPVEVTWSTDPYLLTSETEVLAAEAAGDVTLSRPVTEGTFLCPLIPQ